jgi:hypothetical protein
VWNQKIMVWISELFKLVSISTKSLILKKSFRFLFFHGDMNFNNEKDSVFGYSCHAMTWDFFSLILFNLGVLKQTMFLNELPRSLKDCRL